MRRSLTGRASVVMGGALLTGLAACSAITSLDGLTGGSGLGKLDGSSGAADDGSGGASDAGGVTPTGDGGSGTGLDGAESGGSSYGATIGDAGTGFCASQSPTPAFCDDFDEPGSLTVGSIWNQVTSQNGTASLSTTESSSAPQSLKTMSVAGQSSYDCAAYKQFPSYAGTKSAYTLSFDVFVGQSDLTSNAGAILAAFQLFDGTGERYDVQLEVSYDPINTPTELNVAVSEDTAPGSSDAGYIGHNSNAHILLDTWTHVTFVFDANDPGSPLGNTATWTIGGTATTIKPVVTVLNGSPEILMGLSFVAANNQAWGVYYDNITFDAQPL